VKKSKLSERGLLYRLARCGQHRTLSICGAKFVLFRDFFTGATPLGFRFLDFFTHWFAGMTGSYVITIVAPQARCGANRRIAALAMATQPAVGDRSGRAM